MNKQQLLNKLQSHTLESTKIIYHSEFFKKGYDRCLEDVIKLIKETKEQI